MRESEMWFPEAYRKARTEEAAAQKAERERQCAAGYHTFCVCNQTHTYFCTGCGIHRASVEMICDMAKTCPEHGSS